MPVRSRRRSGCPGPRRRPVPPRSDPPRGTPVGAGCPGDRRRSCVPTTRARRPLRSPSFEVNWTRTVYTVSGRADFRGATWRIPSFPVTCYALRHRAGTKFTVNVTACVGARLFNGDMMRVDHSGAGPVDPERFRHVVGHLASGVTVLTTTHEDQTFGMT